MSVTLEQTTTTTTATTTTAFLKSKHTLITLLHLHKETTQRRTFNNVNLIKGKANQNALDTAVQISLNLREAKFFTKNLP